METTQITQTKKYIYIILHLSKNMKPIVQKYSEKRKNRKNKVSLQFRIEFFLGMGISRIVRDMKSVK